MISNDHLHRLICSLTRAEKRYFKLYTSRHLLGDHSNHQTLFDAVAKMKVYDEKALLKKFKGEAFTNRFPIAKRRLYDMILKSLDAFHAESSLEAKLRRNIHQVEILFKKGLYKDAAKILRSIRKQAVQHEMHTLVIDVKLWERRLMERTNYVELKPGEIEAASAEMKDLLNAIRNEGQLWELKSQLFETLYRKGRARNKDLEVELQHILEHEVLKKEPDTIQAKYLFHHTRGAHAYALNDLKNCLVHLNAQLEILEENKVHFQEEPHYHLAVLSNLIHVNNALGYSEKAAVLLERFKALPTKIKTQMSEDLELRFFVTGAGLELDSIMQNGNFSHTSALLPEIEIGLVRFSENIGTARKAGLYYQIAYNLFACGQNAQALSWTNRLLSDVHIDKSEDIICFAHMLNLLIHLDQGNDKLIPYALRSTERFLKTRERVYDFELAFLQMVRGISKAKSNDQERTVLSDFIKSCEALFKEKKESPVFDRLHPIAWAKARLHGVTIEQQLRNASKAA